MCCVRSEKIFFKRGCSRITCGLTRINTGIIRENPRANPRKSALSRIFKIVFALILLFYFNCFANEQFKYDSKGVRDPFVPLISEEGGVASDAYNIASFGEVRLEGIIWDPSGSSMALINGEMVKEGDMLGEMKILKIEKDSVRLSIAGEEVVIRLSSE